MILFYAFGAVAVAASLLVITHPNPNVLTPGYWMLFAVDTEGVPSEAHSVLVSPSLAPTILTALAAAAPGVPAFVVNDLRHTMGVVSPVAWGHPDRDLDPHTRLRR